VAAKQIAVKKYVVKLSEARSVSTGASPTRPPWPRKSPPGRTPQHQPHQGRLAVHHRWRQG